MDPMTLGAGALPALESFTGGHAGPSNAFLDSKATANMNFNHGAVNFGSNNGVPTWAVIGLLVIGGWYAFKHTK
ncbi:hypothetical protein ACODM8_14395 [Vibrio ostreicida]|uniref:hypothetical protein n=1 Tax=Vibrio ostreicida TaxID=526588 RepID=UPI003B5B6E1D